MNREDIIRIAREVDMDYLQYISPEAFEKVVRFAALVASAEREACAKVCEDLDAWNMDDPAFTAVKAIRARGQE